MKILQFIYDSPRNPWVGGGGAFRVQKLLSHMRDFGHEVTIVYGQYPDSMAGELWNGLKSVAVGCRANNYALSTLAYTTMAQNFLSRSSHFFDVIIEDFAPWNPVFTYKNPSETPAALQIQNYLGDAIPRKYPVIGHLFQRFETRYPKNFRNRIYVNQSLVNAYQLTGKVIPMGVEKSAIDLSLSKGSYIGFLGRIDFAQKGLDDLINAASQLKIPIKIAGKGPDEERLREEISPHPHIEWIGPVSGSQKWKFLDDCRILAMPSNFEGQPLVALEAAAVGIPIIASPIRELDFIAADQLGAQTNTKDAVCFADCLKEWFSAPEKCMETGKKGKEFTRTKTWKDIAKQFEEYCYSIIKYQKQGDS